MNQNRGTRTRPKRSHRQGRSSRPLVRSPGGQRLVRASSRPVLKVTWESVRRAATKVVALAALLWSSGLLYDVASSQEFRPARVVVSGNNLLGAEEVEAALSLDGANLFQIRPGEVAKRLMALPPVAEAHVRLVLPDRMEVSVRERVPVAIWQTSDSSYLVDREGLLISSRLDTRPRVVIQDQGSGPMAPGSRVNADAVGAAIALSELLPQAAGFTPQKFEYSPEHGISVVTPYGWRAVFGSSKDLDWKVATLLAVRDHLAQAGARAELVDVRFSGRPYYR